MVLTSFCYLMSYIYVKYILSIDDYRIKISIISEKYDVLCPVVTNIQPKLLYLKTHKAAVRR